MANSEQVIYVNLNTRNDINAAGEPDDEFSALRLTLGKLKTAIANAVTGATWQARSIDKRNAAVPNRISDIGGRTLGFNLKSINTPQIPHLAHGAVLPANKPFLAVVGDQKHGTNIEAPLETMKQALAEVLALEGGETVVSVNFAGDLAQLARVLKPAIETETRRRGGSLAKGAAF